MFNQQRKQFTARFQRDATLLAALLAFSITVITLWDDDSAILTTIQSIQQPRNTLPVQEKYQLNDLGLQLSKSAIQAAELDLLVEDRTNQGEGLLESSNPVSVLPGNDLAKLAEIRLEGSAQTLWSEPVFEKHYTIFSLSTAGIFGDLKSLAGKRVGYESGTSVETLLLNESKVRVVDFGSYCEGIDALIHGKIDAWIGDEWLMHMALSSSPPAEIVHSLEPVLVVPVGLSFHSDSSTLIEEFNQGLKTIQANGVRAKVLASWAGREIDGVLQARKMARYQLLVVSSVICGLLIFAWVWMRSRDYGLQIKSMSSQHELSLRAKEMFISTVAHEIRTPLNSVIGLADIGVQAKSHTEALCSLYEIKDASEHLCSLVNDVLDLSKLQAGASKLHLEPLKLLRIERNLRAMFSQKATQAGLRFEIEQMEGLPLPFLGDRTRLLQILTNLIGNSFKFTKQGEIRLVISPATMDEGQEAIDFKVIDSGIGIPADALQRIFRPFEQVEDFNHQRSAQGTGLGLALTKQLVELMGGTISVDSQEHKGSVFSFVIPVQRATEEQWTESQKRYLNESDQINPELFAGKQILMAEDHSLNARINSRLLESLGFSVLIATDGHDAINKVVQSISEKSNFDLILMDIQMPGISGLEATRIIRSFYTDLRKCPPIVAFTAGVSVEKRQEILDSGMVGMLSKPFKLEEAARELFYFLSEAGDIAAKGEVAERSDLSQQFRSDEEQSSTRVS